jgi:hypothetical protein
MSKVDTITIAIVFAFAAFIVAGLAITPALQEANANTIDTLSLKTEDNKEPTPVIKKGDGEIKENDRSGIIDKIGR